MDLETWRLLRELARLRSERLGGQASQAAVIRDLIREAADEQGLGPAPTPRRRQRAES